MWKGCVLSKCLVLVFLLCLSVRIFAVPAKPGLWKLLTLTDGTTVDAMLVGDEYAHYWVDADGNAYQSENDDVYKMVDLQAVRQRGKARRSVANKQRTRRLAPRKVGEVGSIIGKKKGLIILVNFSDVAFQSVNDNALYQRIANEENFSYGNFKGSIHDYFYDQSEGLFELTFDVVGPVTVSKRQSYYGENDEKGNDKNPAEMVIEAVRLANSQVNYADYDWDGDGVVDQVYVVYAGKGEADGGAASTIWPHEYNLYYAHNYGDGDGPQKLDGVWVNTYACGGELNGRGNIAGIGTMCHEFSHCLGFPDFYDTDYSGGQGMFEWDLMDSGSYNGNGYCPAGYTSYERWAAGWKEPIELYSSQEISHMAALQDYGSNTYVIYNDGNPDEYFLLENRQKTKWDADLPGAGLLILHVDYDAGVWQSNESNDDPDHQRMTWIPADNQYPSSYISQGQTFYQHEDVSNDPFPYGLVNAFGRNTTPAAKLYNQNSDGTYYLDSSVDDITRNSDGTISFRFTQGTRKLTLKATPASGMVAYGQEMTLTANRPEAKIYYTTDGSEPTPSSYRYSGSRSIGRNMTLKAKAYLDGYEPSETLTRTYQVKLDIKADKPSGDVPSGESVTLSCSHPKAVIYYTTDGTTPTKTSKVYRSPITIGGNMTLKAIAMHDDCLSSDVLTRTYTVPVVALSASPASGTVSKGTKVTLKSTPSDADIFYTMDGTTPSMSSKRYTTGGITIQKNTALKAIAYRQGYIESSVLSANYSVKLTLQASLSSGTVDYLSQVRLTADDTDAAIYYTTDGSTPTKASVRYSGPIVIDHTTTIKAVAMHDDYVTSDVLTRTYTVQTTSVSASPVTAARLIAGTEVTLTANPSDSRICYTTDGSEPTESSRLYTSPIILERTVVLKAKAFRDGYRPGETFTWNYNVAPEPKVITLTPAKFELFWGRTEKLTYAFTPADAETMTLEWESSDPEVAIVTQQGMVKALTPGKTTLTLTARNGVVGKCELTVPAPLYKLFVWSKSGLKTGYLSTDEPHFSVVGDIVRFTTDRLSMDIRRDTLDKFTLEPVLPEHPKHVIMPSVMTLPLGLSEQLDVTLRPSDAKTSLTWFCDNPEVASVTQDGLVTALAAGEANVTVQTSNGLRATCRITVPQPFLRFFVWLRNGEVHVYDIDEHPEVTLGETVFTLLRTGRQPVYYSAADVEKFTLQDEALVDGVSLPEAMLAKPGIEEDNLSIEGSSPYSPVRIYDADGRLVQTAQTDGEGRLSLPLGQLRAGIYIICTDKTTLKIQKR